MPHLITLILLFLVFLNAHGEVVITPSEVYSQVLVIEQETALIKNHLHITTPAARVVEVKKALMPRHVWQKSYMLQMKIVAFRIKHELGALAPTQIAPAKKVDPRYTWAQTQRTISEIGIVRKLLGINGNIVTPPLVEGKTPMDVFNKLNQIEAEWDVLADTSIDASYAFAQAMRLNEDLNTIFDTLNLFDSAIPPAKITNSIPRDSLIETFRVLEQIQRLQKLAGIDLADLSDFRRTGEQVTPSEVFNMMCLLLAEVQTLKAELGIVSVTVPAKYYTDKKPADVLQLLGYIVNKFALISHL